MRAIIQRVSKASVEVDGNIVGSCGQGFLILLGISKIDKEEDAELLAEKISKLRIFNDEKGKLNLSIKDIYGSVLVISNFTLYADYHKGNRPDYFNAASADVANFLYEYFKLCLSKKIDRVESGIFGADMKVDLINDGPVTIVMESESLKKVVEK